MTEIKFLIDAQLPPALARFLAEKSGVAIHVTDVGAKDATDSWIWDKALSEEWVLVTKDEDFPMRAALSKAAPVIVWIRFGNTSRKELLRRIEPMVDWWIERIDEGERLLEVR
jgi:predicted nuclease of predicted toxin-antitoxin system